MAQNIQFDINANDRTKAALAGLRNNLNKTHTAVGGLTKGLGGMTAALGLAAGAAGFGALASKGLETADNLAKVSDRTGFAVERLTGFQLAANLAGVSTSDFNMSLQRFQNRTGEAAAGTGTARQALEDFGISAQELIKLPIDQQLLIIADEFSNLENASVKTRVAQDLFGRSGVAMINVLTEGSGAIEDQIAGFKSLGLTVDRDALNSIEQFNDTMELLSSQIQFAFINALSDATPEITRVAEKLSEMAVPLIGGVLDGLTFMLENLDTITAALKHSSRQSSSSVS
jgi:hypothetical protein